jgi:hypothetical protein
LIDTTNSPEMRIWQLANHLSDKAIGNQLVDCEPKLTLTAVPVTVQCAPRRDAGGELWFFFTDGEPIAPADDAHIHETVTAIKGRLEQAGTPA